MGGALALILCCWLFCGGLLQAQDSGQLCVRTYADYDADGARGRDELLVSEGLGVELMNMQGVTIATGFLADSPFAVDGIFCFDRLASGEYSVRLTSATYAGTGAPAVSARVLVGSPPPLIDLGARPLFEAESSSHADLALDNQSARDLLLAAGALAAALLLAACTLALLVLIKPRGSRSRPMPLAESANR